MISISTASDPRSGQNFCVHVKGHSGGLSVLAELDGVVLPTEVVSKNGHSDVCVMIPPGSRGKAISVSVADSLGNENGIVRFVGK